MSALAFVAALQLAASCAPQIAPETWLSVVNTESGFNGPVIGFNTFAIGDNTSGRSYAPASLAQAVSLASALVAAGHSVDLGVAQINSAAGHLQRRGLPLAAAFDPCTGFRVGGDVLADCYRRAVGTDEQARIHAALGCYNGDRTGAYARRVLASAERIVPAIRLAGQAAAPTAGPAPSAGRPAASPSPPPCAPSWAAWALAECSARRAALPPASPPVEGAPSTSAKTNTKEPGE